MKPWEVLKAVDEGKTVQYKDALGGWQTPTMVTFLFWTVETICKTEWRIKPEPRKFELAIINDRVTEVPVVVRDSAHKKLLQKSYEGFITFIEVTENVS